MEISSIGRAGIEKSNMRIAYNQAVHNALINAIRQYYSQQNSDNMPDISKEYIKFVKSFKVVSQEVIGSTISIKIVADLDNIGLQDANIYINNSVNTAVFTYYGVNEDILSNDRQARIINNALVSKNFTTNDQDNFIQGITDIKSSSDIKSQFGNTYSFYLFKFSFDGKFKNLSNPDFGCELITTTDILSKNSETHTLKIETNSTNKNQGDCISDAMSQAVVSTIDYIRKNLIETTGDKELHKYQIKAINFKNMVGTNNFLSALKQRGFIQNYKAISFTGKEVVFEIDTYFNKEDLSNKLYSVKSDDMNFKYEVDSKGITLDFASDVIDIN